VPQEQPGVTTMADEIKDRTLLSRRQFVGSMAAATP
jgi:hypothetical protein